MSSSFTHTAENAIILDIKQALTDDASRVTFAIGGSVPLRQMDRTGESIHVPPIQIRFGASGNGQTLTLPLPSGHDTSSEFESLLAACKRVTLGEARHDAATTDDEDGNDEEGENDDGMSPDEDTSNTFILHPLDFATSFCPYDLGIIDLTQQILLPRKMLQQGWRGTRAVLRALEVCSAPGGMLERCYYAPQYETHFGVLCITLPVEHEGGKLVVHHEKEGSQQKQGFDSSQSLFVPPVIHWTAFDVAIFKSLKLRQAIGSL